jgi:HlyD family secretion protein
MYRLCFVLAILLFVSCSKQKVKTDVPTAIVQNGEFLIDLVEEGEIEAVNAISISSPAMSWRYGQLKITTIIEDGAEISKNDTIIRFDPAEVQKVILDSKSKIEIAQAELDKLRAQQESKIIELESNLEISEISHRISEIKLEQSSYEADIVKKEINLSLHKAKLNLDKAKQEIQNQKKIHIEEIKQSKLTIQQRENELIEAEKTLNSLNVVSPAKGLAIIRKNWNTGNKWQVGDQPWSGSAMIELPDLSVLKIIAEINEVDIAKLKIGQNVEIKLDAFSDSVYSGTRTNNCKPCKIER